MRMAISMEPKYASRHNTARTSAVCHQIVRKSAIFSIVAIASRRAIDQQRNDGATNQPLTAPKAIIILRNVNRHAPGQHRPNDSQKRMEAPDAGRTNPPHICYIAKDNEDATISPSRAQSRQPPTERGADLQLVQCVKQESASHGTVPADSSDAAGPNALIYAITDARPPSPPIRPLATCSSTWVDIITSDTTIDSTGKTSRNTIFATLNRPVPTQSNRHCFTTDFQLIVTTP